MKENGNRLLNKCFLEDVTDQYDNYDEYWVAFLNTRDNEERRKAKEHAEKEKVLAEDLAWSYARTSKKRGKELKEEIAKILCGYNISERLIVDMLDFSYEEVETIKENLDDKYKKSNEEDNRIMQIKFDDKNDSEDLIRGRLEGMLVEKINTLIRMKKAYHFYDCDGYWVTKLEYDRIDKICENPLKELDILMKRVLKEGIESVRGNQDKKEETFEEKLAKIDREAAEKDYRYMKGIAKKMILDNEPIEKIIKYSKLSEKEIEEIKNGTLI